MGLRKSVQVAIIHQEVLKKVFDSTEGITEVQDESIQGADARNAMAAQLIPARYAKFLHTRNAWSVTTQRNKRTGIISC